MLLRERKILLFAEYEAGRAIDRSYSPQVTESVHLFHTINMALLWPNIKETA
jgi:hypothetical protein